MTTPQKPWAKMDQPIDQRTVDNVFFGFKRVLVDWKYNKRCIRVDTDAKVLKVAGKEILKVAVQDYKLILQWQDSEWQQWEDLQTAAEFTKIQSDAQTKLERAKDFASEESKGKGKGPQ